jgi:hypothetical protein
MSLQSMALPWLTDILSQIVYGGFSKICLSFCDSGTMTAI